MTIPRRTFLHLAACAAAWPAVPRMARAEACPSRPVHFIVGFPAGGATDIQARLMGQWLSDRLGQQFIVENRAGASGNIGTEAVAKAPADGYTLLQIVTPNVINAALYSNLNFDFMREIAPVVCSARLAYMVVVNPQVPVQCRPRRSQDQGPDRGAGRHGAWRHARGIRDDPRRGRGKMGEGDQVRGHQDRIANPGTGALCASARRCRRAA
jgi:hypothetical protein